jgi:hypothetical protein
VVKVVGREEAWTERLLALQEVVEIAARVPATGGTATGAVERLVR